MSDEAPEQSSKTEDPSERKLRDAQEKGNVVKSQEVNTWFILSGSALVFALMAAPTSTSLVGSLRILLESAEKFEVGSQALTQFWNDLAGSILMVALLPSIVLAAFAIAANLVQHRPLLSLEPLKPKFSKINPLEGAKRLFGVDALVNFVKGLIKLAVVSAVLWFVLAPEGTRRKVDNWKTGFWKIARRAGVPVLCVGFDYPDRAIRIGELVELTDDMEADLLRIRAKFASYRGKHRNA